MMQTIESPRKAPQSGAASKIIKGLQVVVAGSMLTFISLTGVIAGSFFWSAYFSAAPAQNWNGCAAPRSAAEHQAWIASAKATGETLCEPGVIENE